MNETAATKTGNEILENDLCYYLYFLIRGGGVFGGWFRQGDRDISVASDSIFWAFVGRSVSRPLSVNKCGNEEGEVVVHRADVCSLRNISGVHVTLVAGKS